MEVAAAADVLGSGSGSGLDKGFGISEGGAILFISGASGFTTSGLAVETAGFSITGLKELKVCCYCRRNALDLPGG